jgi:hypothetical protein
MATRTDRGTNGETTATGIRCAATRRRHSDQSAAGVDDVYLPLKQLSAYGGLSVRTLRGYLTHALHPLPHFRIGGRVLVRRSDYDAWAARFRVTPAERVADLVEGMLKGL